jgi:hypothetical protein
MQGDALLPSFQPNPGMSVFAGLFCLCTRSLLAHAYPQGDFPPQTRAYLQGGSDIVGLF